MLKKLIDLASRHDMCLVFYKQGGDRYCAFLAYEEDIAHSATVNDVSLHAGAFLTLHEGALRRLRELAIEAGLD